MTTATAAHFGPSATEFAGLADPTGPGGRALLERIAARIGATRRPGARSDIPAGATYLAQFAVHDLDFRARMPGLPAPGGEQLRLDLGLIYGDGPRHDAFCYQVPAEPGLPRHLLRIGRTRPTTSSPAWGAARDLPRVACPHFDAEPVEVKSEVLVPNSFSDSNALIAQMQTLWALAHNAIAQGLGEQADPARAFALASGINRRIYHAVLRHDLLGNWLMPRLRNRYASAAPKRLWNAPMLATPPEFMAGVARLGHGMVREIYSLNDNVPVMGLRNIIRHTSTGRPHDMPLTEDWLVDFARFFKIGASVPQRARALGPHVARPFATGAVGGAGSSAAAESLVLRDLCACTSGGVRSVASLIDAARSIDTRVFDGCFAQDETIWGEVLRAWLAGAGLSEEETQRLAADPPLTLFLMLEAEADADGRCLGALGSVLMGETFAAALAQTPQGDAAELDAASAAVFRGPAPATMEALIRFLQDHYRFADGARLHAADIPGPDAAHGRAASTRSHSPREMKMLDVHTQTRKPIPRIEVADYIEMGRLVAQWAVDPATWPRDVAQLKEQLDGIAEVPERIKHVEFVQSTLDTLVLRLPVKQMIEESLEAMTDPMGDTRYPLPQFYADHYRPGFGPVMTPLDTLLARVGDYTIAQCK